MTASTPIQNNIDDGFGDFGDFEDVGKTKEDDGFGDFDS